MLFVLPISVSSLIIRCQPPLITETYLPSTGDSTKIEGVAGVQEIVARMMTGFKLISVNKAIEVCGVATQGNGYA